MNGQVVSRGVVNGKNFPMINLGIFVVKFAAIKFFIRRILQLAN